MMRAAIASLFALLLSASVAHAYRWADPVKPAIPGTSAYVPIPTATVRPQPARIYRAVYDATRAAEKPDQILPALDMAGSELNLFAAEHVPFTHVKFAVVFHGAALDGILDDAHYRAKHGMANPNLPVIAAMKRAGVEFFVCGQNLAYDQVDPATLTPDVKLALDALVVLMTYQNTGYALLSF